MTPIVENFLRSLYWDGRLRTFAWGIWLPLLLLLSAILGVSGPFGTYSLLPLVPRLLFYKLSIIAVAPVAWGLTWATSSLAARLHWSVIWGLRTLLFSVLVVPLTIGLFAMFEPWMLGPAPGLLTITLKTFFIGLAIFGAQMLFRSAQPWIKAPPPRLLARLSGHEGARIWRLSADDHYVSVLIDGRVEERLLMRLSDAVAEMDTAEGLLVHRSHWVARDAIREARREGGKDVVVLRNGSRLPVSRTYREGLVELGLLEPRPASDAGAKGAAEPATEDGRPQPAMSLDSGLTRRTRQRR
ncbi:LytTR family DNA-binding domain-containing protein [Pseudoroseicyclus sp. H15]